MSRFIPLLLTAVVVGCSSPVEGPSRSDALLSGDAVGGLSLSVSQSAYDPPAEAVVTLSNQSTSVVGYNTCSAAWEQQARSIWKRIEPFRVCTAELLQLAPGKQITFEESITEEWEPGVYRFVLKVIAGSGDPVTLTTGNFTVAK